MDVEIKSWLFDILTAIIEIESFLSNPSLDFPGYQNDLKTKRAVERNIEIIGEATRLLTKDSSIGLSHSRKIVDTRNRIIHGYDSVSDDIIWGIIINHLPLLKSEVVKFLND